MPRYKYIAKSHPEKSTSGEIEAESERDAINKLIQMGYFPISIKGDNLSEAKAGILNFRRVSNKEIALFTEQLSSLIESGVSILNSLNTISGQTKNKYLKAVLYDVIARIKDGNSLSDSLAAHPDVFSGLYSSLMHTGEASGNLKNTINQLAEFLEKQEEFKNSLCSSLIYPAFVCAVGVLTVAVLLIFVIPRLVNMFEDMGQMLPLPTRILISASGFMRSYWWLIFLTVSICIFLFYRVLRTMQGRTAWDRLKLKMAILGPIILKTEISRLTRTLSLLLSGGMPITSGLEISTTVIDNQILKAEAIRFKDLICNGSSLSVAFKTSRLFPDVVTNIVEIGEETGVLDKSLLRIAEDYEKEVSRTLKTLTRMLEPVIILVMGLIVGFIVLSMLLPIFQINLIAR
jgi:type II secretion system protein F